MSKIVERYVDTWRPMVDRDRDFRDWKCDHYLQDNCPHRATWVCERIYSSEETGRHLRTEVVGHACLDHCPYLQEPLERLVPLTPIEQTRSLRQLQVQLPWTIHYSRDFRSSSMAHKDFGHALLHVTKACGKLASAVNDAEHAGCDFKDIEPYVADLVICALRMANTRPGGPFDLEKAVVNRIETKNEMKLANSVAGTARRIPKEVWDAAHNVGKSTTSCEVSPHDHCHAEFPPFRQHQ